MSYVRHGQPQPDSTPLSSSSPYPSSASPAINLRQTNQYENIHLITTALIFSIICMGIFIAFCFYYLKLRGFFAWAYRKFRLCFRPQRNHQPLLPINSVPPTPYFQHQPVPSNNNNNMNPVSPIYNP